MTKNMEKNSLGIVQPQSFVFAEGDDKLKLKSGVTFGPVELAYETYGELNRDKSNAILICHTLTFDAHAAGRHDKNDKHPGWWDGLVGPDKAFDTDKYFIISSNCLGSCKGSSGPASVNPETGRPYGLAFPFVTIEDMVAAQKHLVGHLGIKKLLSVAGGSMGGLQALKWATQYPENVESIICISANMRHTAQQIALHEVGRQAIMSDPDWNNGDYYGKAIPARGMALARMIGHITYMSDKSMDDKFGRKLIDKEQYGYDFEHDFEVESYLKYRGSSFVQRFEVFKNISSKFLVISFTSDWLYPPYQAKEMTRALKAANVDVTNIEIKSTYGHDAFLLETGGQTRLIKHFLTRIQKENGK
jgi:homoserine O-acetyltransferase/O-succinyltransferase